MGSITFRPVTEDEYPSFARAVVEGFSEDLADDDFADHLKTLLPPERTIAAFQGSEIVGTIAGYDLELTIPGGCLAMEGTTVVTVFPTHRRMGLMQEMMGLHLDGAAKNGVALAGLWASDSAIYGRYGYGAATYAETVTMNSRDVMFREDVAIGRVRRVSVEEATGVLPPIFDAVLARTPGMLARTSDSWKVEVLHDATWRRRGRTSLRVVVHEGADGPDGYAIYRQKSGERGDGHANGTVHVSEVITATDQAHASLWSYLTRVDGCPNVRWWNFALEDPLPMKLKEPRKLTREKRFDALWILILDVVAALEARTYGYEDSLRFTVANAFRKDVEGSYEIVIERGIGSCIRVEGDTEIEIDLDVLGALYLGGGDAHAYAAAGRIRADTGAVGRLHALFHTARVPWCNQVF